MAKRTLAISTLGTRIAQVTLPLAQNEWDILVLWQNPQNAAPAHLDRSDVRLIRLNGQGAARSRNAALSEVKEGLLQFWDDDMIPDEAGLNRLASYLEEHPRLSVVTGRRRGLTAGRASGSGPGVPLTQRNIARAATPEILVRAEKIHEAGVRFDERFGLGAQYPLGDEFVFLADCLTAGLKGWHLPVAIGEHPPQSTGDVWQDPTLLRARAAAIRRVFGPVQAFPMGAAFSCKHVNRMGLLNALRFPWMCLGALA